jgi:Protein of unknown function (DUF4232)
VRSWILVPALVLTALAASASGLGETGATFCSGVQLTGTFSVVPGSAGAGNIVYALRLENRSAHTCAVTGLPVAQLRNRARKPLPTHVRAAFPGALTAVLVRLAPGQTTTAMARFSPDVPGQGEPVAGRQCEPTAYALRVSARGGGSTIVRVKPPTPVCEHGQLQFSAYGKR